MNVGEFCSARISFGCILGPFANTFSFLIGPFVRSLSKYSRGNSRQFAFRTGQALFFWCVCGSVWLYSRALSKVSFQVCSRELVTGLFSNKAGSLERWGAGVDTQKNVRGEIGGWGRVPFNETYAPSLSTIYDGA